MHVVRAREINFEIVEFFSSLKTRKRKKKIEKKEEKEKKT
jgi:hypothetical protein